MPRKPKPASKDEQKPKRSLGERLREHLLAAEVAAEEAAGYGWATEAVEAAEAAVEPEHELGDDDSAKKSPRRPDSAA